MASTLIPGSFIAFVALFASGILSQHDKPPAISLSSNATCPARTANYITHTLPQLCLTSSRVVPTNTTSSDADHGSSTGSSETSSSSPDITSASMQLNLTPTIPAVLTSSLIALDQDTAASTPLPAGIETRTVDQDIDSELELGSARFLSFEEWKRQNLAKSGQSEYVGKSRQDGHLQRRRKPTHVSDALDSLGDDAEIDLDFAGFAAERPDVAPPGQNARSGSDGEAGDKEESTAAVKSEPRSKDAGTTGEERFNYASFDCAATVLKTNPQAKGSSAVLSENKDSYMLNECSADNKFLILELCNDIYIDTIVLANFEFFSSIFRIFQVSVSDIYPAKAEKWKTLGTFEARNSREVQAFLVENPLIWARYLRIEFLTHYGSEYYCPVSLIRVHGTTMMEDYKHDLEANRAEEESKHEGISNISDDVEPMAPEAVAEVFPRAEEAGCQNGGPAAESQPTSSSSQLNSTEATPSTHSELEFCPYNKTKEAMLRMDETFNALQSVCTRSDLFMDSMAGNMSASLRGPTQEDEASGEEALIYERGESNSLPPVTSNASSAFNPALQASVDQISANPMLATTTTAETEGLGPNSRSTASQTKDATSLEHTKSASSSTQPSPATPTIQESFFKSVQKRLQMLESNSSLSLQYIEEQSRNLRDAFGRVEQRQLSKTTAFLDYLNSTVLSELREFRQQYDQLWQSTVIELDTQREHYQKEVLEINSRLAVLADEVIFQKRVSILQSILVLICLGLVLFSRGAMNNYLELPIVQNMLARSPSVGRQNSRILRTPTESPATTRPSSSDKQNPPYSILKSHRSQLSQDLVAGPPSPSAHYSPPTPTSFDAGSDVEEVKELLRLEGSPPDHGSIVRPSSSPPVLEGMEDSQAEAWQVCEVSESPLPNGTKLGLPTLQTPRLAAEESTPPAKHLSFRLPDG